MPGVMICSALCLIGLRIFLFAESQHIDAGKVFLGIIMYNSTVIIPVGLTTVNRVKFSYTGTHYFSWYIREYELALDIIANTGFFWLIWLVNVHRIPVNKVYFASFIIVFMLSPSMSILIRHEVYQHDYTIGASLFFLLCISISYLLLLLVEGTNIKLCCYPSLKRKDDELNDIFDHRHHIKRKKS